VEQPDLTSQRQLYAVAAIGIVVYLAAAYVVAITTLIQRTAATYDLFYWTSDLFAIPLLIYAYRALPHDLRPELALRSIRPRVWLVTIVAAILLISANFFIDWLLALCGIHNLRRLSALFVSRDWLIVISSTLVVGVLSPIIEEVVFRGWLFSGLRRLHTFWPAALISSTCFALMHAAIGLPELLITFSNGLVWCAFVERTRSLIPSIAMHATVNTLAMISAFYLYLR
jgi:membrane protease YdiL (CAAX protease family)